MRDLESGDSDPALTGGSRARAEDRVPEHPDDLEIAYRQRTRQMNDARGAVAEAVHALTVEIRQRREERDQALLENRTLREQAEALHADVHELHDRTEALGTEVRGLRHHTEALDADRRELRDRATTLERELHSAREENVVLRNMKVVRWTVWPRRIVYRLRARRG